MKQNINDTVCMLIDNCGALPHTALRIAQRSEVKVESGRNLVTASGQILCSIEREDFSPHETDVLAKLIAKLLNEHYRHSEGV